MATTKAGTAMTTHGIVPGPQIVSKQRDLFWGMIVSMWIGNAMLVILNLPLIGIWVKMLLVPRAVKQRRASRLAHQLFLDLGLSSTKERTGVLLFVSAAEHYVEIIADRGIQQHVDNAVWDGIVAAFVADVRGGRIADGFVEAIEACTKVMAEHHPWHADDVNELPNRLIEI